MVEPQLSQPPEVFEQISWDRLQGIPREVEPRQTTHSPENRNKVLVCLDSKCR